MQDISSSRDMCGAEIIKRAEHVWHGLADYAQHDDICGMGCVKYEGCLGHGV